MFKRVFFPVSMHPPEEFSVCTWNSRALCHRADSRKKLKAAFLLKTMKNATIISIQEAHGSKQEVDKLLFFASRNFHVVHAGGPDRSTGGLVTLVSETFAENIRDLHVRILVPGRVLRVEASKDGFSKGYLEHS